MRKLNRVICVAAAAVGVCLICGCGIDAVTDGVAEGISSGVAALIEQLIIAVGDGLNNGM